MTMPNNVSKAEMEEYLEDAETWVADLKVYVQSIEGGSVDIGSNPPPPPPPPPGT